MTYGHTAFVLLNNARAYQPNLRPIYEKLLKLKPYDLGDSNHKVIVWVILTFDVPRNVNYQNGFDSTIFTLKHTNKKFF